MTRNYTIDSGTPIDNFTTGLVNGGASGEYSIDPHITRGGHSSIKLTLYSGHRSHSIERPVKKDFANPGVLGAWVYFDGRNAGVRIELQSNGSWSNRFIYEGHKKFIKGWNFVGHHSDKWRKAGTPEWESITRIKINILSDGEADSSVWISGFYMDVLGRAKIMMGFDDGIATQYDAFEYMESLGLKGVLYITGHLIGRGSNYLTMDQLKEVYDAGWDIANHSFRHKNLTSIPVSEARELVEKQEAWLLDNGFTRSLGHLAYPGGYYSIEVLDMLESLGMKTARRVHDPKLIHHTGSTDKLFISGVSHDKSTIPEMKGYVDEAINYGMTVYSFGHSVVEGAADDSYAISMADFKNYCNYVYQKVYVEKVIDNVTVSEWSRNI